MEEKNLLSLCLETDANAWFVAEGIRQELIRKRIPHTQSLAAQYVTISCGIASMIPRIHTTTKTLIERADKGLYRAKQQGRNRIVMFEENTL
jgi:diguanylate cyclase (GGDEF)-like protein